MPRDRNSRRNSAKEYRLINCNAEFAYLLEDSFVAESARLEETTKTLVSQDSKSQLPSASAG
ncbi:hypothetical protein RXV86_17255 [Alisedimentitalea sp. MJ-SS2]|uniref:hypothetical protein n=1 Tax=Aliisedimentitalea sp. MJ-SS2 TaxID=3049795 RepID=UPI002914B240|nr:hypothetical protein [Alisedimentitalea sp. MJ-SS2]MDU8929144.1 hypothetical protein [Alisedimentitalea sp. MJ-SS2]